MQFDSTSIRAVIFDMDGTLVLTNGMHFEAYQKIFDRYGVKADYDDFIQNLIGIGAYNVIKTVFQRNKIELDFAQLAKIKSEIFEEMLANSAPRVVDGLYEFLALLEARGVPRAVASAASKSSIIEVLKNIDVDARMQAVVSCEEVMLPKPAPDVFIEAAKQLGQNVGAPSGKEVAPQFPHCMVIEDTAHGIEAARRAGMIPVALLTTQSADRLKQAGAAHLCKDFFEVAKLFTQ